MPVAWKAFRLRGWETHLEQAVVTFALTPSSVDVEDIVEANTATLALTPKETPVEHAEYLENVPDIFVLGNNFALAQTPTTTQWVAQSFTPVANCLVRTLELFLRGNPAADGNTIVELRQDNANKPGTIVATFTFPNANLSTNLRYEQIAFTNDISLTGGTKYWITVHRDTTTGTVAWGAALADLLANAGTGLSSNSGSTWTVNTQDLFFGVRFDPEPNDIFLKLTPSFDEAAQFVDSDTDRLVFVASSIDEAAYVDSNTEGILLVPVTNDILSAVESGLESLSLLPATSENFQGSDSDTENLIISPTALDTAQFVDTNSELFALIGSADESQSGGATDAATERLLLGPTANDIADFIDQAAERIALSILSSDIAQFIELGPRSESFKPTTNSAFSIVDQAERCAQSFQVVTSGRVDSIELKLNKGFSPTDSLIIEIQDDNSGNPSNNVLTSGSILGSSIVSGNYHRIDLLDNISLSSGVTYWIVIRRTVTDGSNFYNIQTEFPGSYTDGFVRFSTNSGGSWSTTISDLPFVINFEAITNQTYVSFGPASDDVVQFVDAATNILSLGASGTDSYIVTITNDEATIPIVITPSDRPDVTDEATTYLRLSPLVYELYKIYELIASVPFRRYFAKTDELRYSTSIMFKRWWAKF